MAIQNGSVFFKDPWLINYPDPLFGNNLRNQGMNAQFKPRSSPFFPDYNTSYGGEIYRGVFLNENPTYIPQQPYYSVRFLKYMTPNFQYRDPYGISFPLLPGEWSLYEFYTSGASHVSDPDPNSWLFGYHTDAVVFQTQNALVEGRYKAHLHSNKSISTTESECPTCPNSQRKIAVDNNGVHHLVYESAGQIWYTQSFDDNSQYWKAEIRLDDGITPSMYPNITVSGADVHVVWNQGGEVRMRKKTAPQYNVWETILFVGIGAIDCHPVITADSVEQITVVAYETEPGLQIVTDCISCINWPSPIFDLIPNMTGVKYPTSIRRYGSMHELAWFDKGDIYYARVSASTNPWPPYNPIYSRTDPPEIVPLGHGNPNAITPPSITVDDNVLPCVAWSLIDSDPKVLAFSKRAYWGWTPPDFIFDATRHYWGPSVNIFVANPYTNSIRIAHSTQTYPYGYIAPFRIQKLVGSSWYTEEQLPSTGSGEDLHPNAIAYATGDKERLVLPFLSPVHPSLNQLDIKVDQLLSNCTSLKCSRELLIKKDTTQISLLLGELVIQKQSNLEFLDWNLGTDTLVLGKTTTIQDQFKTRSFTVDNGMTLKYRAVDMRKGHHSFPSGMSIVIKLMDVNTNHPLTTLSILQLNSLLQGKRSNVLSHSLNSFLGDTIFR